MIIFFLNAYKIHCVIFFTHFPIYKKEFYAQAKEAPMPLKSLKLQYKNLFLCHDPITTCLHQLFVNIFDCKLYELIICCLFTVIIWASYTYLGV